MSLYICVNRASTLPLATTVTPTFTPVYPLLVAAMVAVELTVAAAVAATVTVWPVFQLAGVNASDAGVAETVVAPALRAIVTVVFAVGAVERATLKVLVSPGETDTEVVSLTMAGVVLASTNTGTSAVLHLTPAESYAMACRW